MNIPKKKKQLVILSVLGLVLLASLYYSFQTSSLVIAPAGVAPGDKSTAVLQGLVVERNRSKGKKSLSLATADPTIHMEMLLTFDPGKPLDSRNMFAFESAPPVANSKVKDGTHRPGTGLGDAKPPGAISAPSGAQGPPPTPPVVINLKFYGIKINSVTKRRQGFFAEGAETFLVGEGELVGNRYRVLKVGDASAEIEEVASKTRRQLPMVTQ